MSDGWQRRSDLKWAFQRIIGGVSLYSKTIFERKIRRKLRALSKSKKCEDLKAGVCRRYPIQFGIFDSTEKNPRFDSFSFSVSSWRFDITLFTNGYSCRVCEGITQYSLSPSSAVHRFLYQKRSRNVLQPIFLSAIFISDNLFQCRSAIIGSARSAFR